MRLRRPSASSRRHRPALLGVLVSSLALTSCGVPEPEPVALSLVDRFRDATVLGAIDTATGPPRVRWQFGGEAALEVPDNLVATQGWEALHGVEDLAVREGMLSGKIIARPVLVAAVPGEPDDTDSFHAFQIEIKVSAGSRLGVRFVGDEELERGKVVARATKDLLLDFNTDLLPGGNFRNLHPDQRRREVRDLGSDAPHPACGAAADPTP